MFIEKDLIIKNCNMGCPNMTGVKEEDLGIFAPRSLNDFYQYNHPDLSEALGLDADADSMTRMMAVLPHIAAHFGLDKNNLLSAWVADYGMAHLAKTLLKDLDEHMDEHYDN